MKKIFAVSFILIFTAAFAFAGTFAPTPLMITGDDVVAYSFDGSNAEIPITVSGHPALVRFMVFTKDKADEIIDVRNGFLGWHYMNKIDTCVYMSNDMNFTTGSQTITWDGKDTDGGVVPKGSYTYYLWGYDDQSPRIRAHLRNQGYQSTDLFIETDEAGNLLPNPIHMLKGGRENIPADSENKYRTFVKWTLGSDPEDQNLEEWSAFDLGEGFGESDYGSWWVPWFQQDVIYGRMFNMEATTSRARKYEWVPNDLAVLVPEFDIEISMLNNYSGSEYDDNYLYYGECNYKEQVVRTYLHIIDYSTAEGEYIGYIDNSEVFESVDDFENYGGLMNSGWTQTVFANGMMMGGNHCCCLRVACEPSYYFEDPEDTMRWENGNGDYNVWDMNFEDTSERPWVCSSLGATVSMHGMGVSKHGFINGSAYYGARSFCASAPDGTGLRYYAYSGEIDQHKGGGHILDQIANGAGPFDGAYVTLTGEGKAEGTAGGVFDGTYFIGTDSFMGTIQEGGVGVEDSAPAAFAVAQNSPNPFNPTTTISYSLADAGNVTIDVFNVAGQKVGTIVDGFTEAGSHSVVWDGSDFSAGVYFYTVKSGDFTKTTKMTLLK